MASERLRLRYRIDTITASFESVHAKALSQDVSATKKKISFFPFCTFDKSQSLLSRLGKPLHLTVGVVIRMRVRLPVAILLLLVILTHHRDLLTCTSEFITQVVGITHNVCLEHSSHLQSTLSFNMSLNL